MICRLIVVIETVFDIITINTFKVLSLLGVLVSVTLNLYVNHLQTFKAKKMIVTMFVKEVK